MTKITPRQAQYAALAGCALAAPLAIALTVAGIAAGLNQLEFNLALGAVVLTLVFVGRLIYGPRLWRAVRAALLLLLGR